MLLTGLVLTDFQLVDQINAELVRVADWTCANRLSINVDKTNVMLFTNRDADRNYKIFNDERLFKDSFFLKMKAVVTSFLSCPLWIFPYLRLLLTYFVCFFILFNSVAPMRECL